MACHGGHRSRAKPRQGKRQGQAATPPDPPSSGKYHARKEADAEQKAPAVKGQRAAPYTSSTLSVATQSLIDMVIVSAASGAVLLGLLAAKHF
jgi:hypothetical protein